MLGVLGVLGCWSVGSVGSVGSAGVLESWRASQQVNTPTPPTVGWETPLHKKPPCKGELGVQKRRLFDRGGSRTPVHMSGFQNPLYSWNRFCVTSSVQSDLIGSVTLRRDLLIRVFTRFDAFCEFVLLLLFVLFVNFM